MIVYVLFHETNTGRGDESDGYVEAVYATEDAAHEAGAAAARKARDEGKRIWWDPDDENHEDEDWTDDWRVEPHEVIGGAA